VLPRRGISLCPTELAPAPSYCSSRPPAPLRALSSSCSAPVEASLLTAGHFRCRAPFPARAPGRSLSAPLHAHLSRSWSSMAAAFLSAHAQSLYRAAPPLSPSVVSPCKLQFPARVRHCVLLDSSAYSLLLWWSSSLVPRERAPSSLRARPLLLAPARSPAMTAQSLHRLRRSVVAAPVAHGDFPWNSFLFGTQPSPAWSWYLAVTPLARLCSPLCRRSARRGGCLPWYSASGCSSDHRILRSPRPRPRRRSSARGCRCSVCLAISVRRPSRHPQSIASCSDRQSADRRVPCFPRRSTSPRLSPSAVLCASVSGRRTSIPYVPCSPPWSCSLGHYSLANYCGELARPLPHHRPRL
jgi:hypothetical protein